MDAMNQKNRKRNIFYPIYPVHQSFVVWVLSVFQAWCFWMKSFMSVGIGASKTIRFPLMG